MPSLLMCRTFILLLLVACLAACSRADIEGIDRTRIDIPTVGVTRTTSGVSVILPSCRPKLGTLSLYSVDGSHYWVLESVDGVDRSVRSISLGEVPEGMRESVRYTPPPPDKEVMLTITSAGVESGSIRYAEFVPESLPVQGLKVGDSVVPADEFQKATSC
ncbi:MAG: hypothetical protein U0Q07_08140 [Acidimicrobiales bacterium]